MAKFVYRLQTVFDLRNRKVKTQEQRVVDARRVVREIQSAIEEKRNEIRLLGQNMMSSHYTLLETYDEFIHHCHEQLDQLHSDLEDAEEALSEERTLLVKYQAELEALEKHKEKALEEWTEEQKRLEMKQLDEVASQRYFRAQEARRLEELGDE